MNDLPPPAYSANTADSRARDDAPGRVTVFVQLLWRTIVISVGGGIVVSLMFIAAAFVFNQNDDELVAWLPLVVAVAAFMGLMLGVGAGVLTGLVGSIVLVPYKGKTFTRGFALVATLISVASFFTIVGVNGGEVVIWLVVGGGALVLGALLSPWLVGWYVRRMRTDVAH